jgi:hypothetical protein
MASREYWPGFGPEVSTSTEMKVSVLVDMMGYYSRRVPDCHPSIG